MWVWSLVSHPSGPPWSLGQPCRGREGGRKAFPKCFPGLRPRDLQAQLLLSGSPISPPQIQTALRHKSEIEHHRNKIRLRAKRRGHYEFPVVDDLSSGDTRERHRVYRRAQMQIDKILDPTASVPSVFIEPRKRWDPSRRLPLLSGPWLEWRGSENGSERFIHRKAVQAPGGFDPAWVAALCRKAAWTSLASGPFLPW